MVHNKAPPQSSKIDKYSATKPSADATGSPSALLGESEHSLGELMAFIRDLKGTLEPKHDAVIVEVSLLRADLKKLSDKVTTVESNVAVLRFTNKQLEEQVQYLTKQIEMVTGKVEDQEGRALRNNIRGMGLLREQRATMRNSFWKTLS
ncbi:hypothetical protein NDU88_004726 [Pleurodeles waltl]|uniref:Uncharacterized protein n=1 Tax=Pleurodeles waltl TaxID=8319 RepID=A0AAV7VK02_PLEWA|nr:hypothetical protein NDU88_004726 [Pleurodeles waltl]